MQINNVFEIRTDAGGQPQPVLAGRVWDSEGQRRIVEQFSPSALESSPNNPYHYTAGSSALTSLEAIVDDQPTTFEYRRVGHDGWHLLEVAGRSMTLDGSTLEPSEVARIVANLDQGAAQIRVPGKATLHSPRNMAKSETASNEDPMLSSIPGLGSALAYESAVFPVLIVTLRAYDRWWHANPELAVSALKTLASVIKELERNAYHVRGGMVALEVASVPEAIQDAQKICMGLKESLTGDCGLLCALVEDATSAVGAIAQLAATVTSGSALAVAGKTIRLN